jgi:uncharacterized protein (DUF169 family)
MLSDTSMSDHPKDPTNAEILTAMQGMWRQQADLVQGLESRIGSKVDAVSEKLQNRLVDAEERLGERLAREIQDRPVVVHVDMSRVSELEKQIMELAKRVAELESRDRAH